MSNTNPPRLSRRRSAPNIMLQIHRNGWKGEMCSLGHLVGSHIIRKMDLYYNESPEDLIVNVIHIDLKASPESKRILLGIHLISRDYNLKSIQNNIFRTIMLNRVEWGIDHMEYVGCCKGPKAWCFHMTNYIHQGFLLFSNSLPTLIDMEVCALAYRHKISLGRAKSLYYRMERGTYIPRKRDR